MLHKAWCCLEKVPYCFLRSSIKFQGHKAKFWPKLGIPGLQLQFEFTHGYKIVHKAQCSMEKVPCCFSMSSIKFQDYMTEKSSILTQSGRSRTVTPVWIQLWLWNGAQSSM